MDLISCEYIGEGSVKSSMRKCKILEKIDFFTYFRYGRNFADGKLAWGKIFEKNPRTPFKNGGNDDFSVYLIGLPKNLGEKLVFGVKIAH